MNDENLIPFSQRTTSEQREIAKQGGKESGLARRKRKALKEQLLLLLENGDIQNNICVALLDKAQNGDIKAFEVIRDTIGEKPTDKHELNTMPPVALVHFVDDVEKENKIAEMEANGQTVINLDIPRE